uniref:Uncharacterized protein n=1 Tax=Panagrolaimus superbus TaxID=310955 RepID=A0A914YMY1_9BILA
MASRGQLVMEDMLKEVQNLVDGLKNKNEVAEWCLAQGNVVTDKLAVMKEYNQEVGFVNTFHAPEGRANLVASLQHESRQIQALQEENRQLEYAIEEMEHGMEMMMAKHREIILNCRRSDKMMDLLAKMQLTSAPSNDEKTMEMAKLLQECLDEHAEENNRFLKDIARLKTENSVLRRLLHASSAENLKIDTVIDKLKDDAIPDDLIPKYFSENKVVEEQEEENNKVIEAEISNIEPTQSQSNEIPLKSNIPTPKNSKSNGPKAKSQAANTSKN